MLRSRPFFTLGCKRSCLYTNENRKMEIWFRHSSPLIFTDSRSRFQLLEWDFALKRNIELKGVYLGEPFLYRGREDVRLVPLGAQMKFSRLCGGFVRIPRLRSEIQLGTSRAPERTLSSPP